MNHLCSTERSRLLNRTIIGLLLIAALVVACGQPTISKVSTAKDTPRAAPSSSTQAPANSSTLNCTPPATLTPAQTEGPYFKAGSPERASLIEAKTTGIKLILTGYVVTADCKPIAQALMEFWQADTNGNYDNNGYTLRGHQYTDANGRYQLTTIVPGLYPGRTEHIHVKVQAPNGPLLTTQLYFPGVTQNDSDGIFDPKMVIDVQQASDGLI
ncbi:MAG TPA: dioxygenase, partial [Anaerolineae bacterium]|nr:dioxygenase [Anaerolineae bacterium]